MDDGFWARIRKCPSCGRFLWEQPPLIISTMDFVLWRRGHAFWYLGFAIEMHERWMRDSWLTAPICVCHPDIYVRMDPDVGSER